MHSYYFAIELPSSAKKQLATLCFGPSQINWVETQNLYFMVRPLGTMAEETIGQIEEEFEALFFHPFKFVLENVHPIIDANGKGIIGVGTSENPLLYKLKKEIDRHLKNYGLKKRNDHALPVILGYFENLHFERLSDYLSTHANFHSDPILVQGLVLLRSRQTNKRVIFEEVAYYEASSEIHGDD